MGNWSSTNKPSAAVTVDASAFTEEKAPNKVSPDAPTADAPSATVSQRSAPAEVAKPKANPAYNAGMRPLDALK